MIIKFERHPRNLSLVARNVCKTLYPTNAGTIRRSLEWFLSLLDKLKTIRFVETILLFLQLIL